jgi:hypothetical protein
MNRSGPIRTLVLLAVSAAIASLGIGTSASAVAQEAPPAEEIVHRANLVSYFQGRDGRAQVSMTITDKQGRTRERQLTMLRRDGPESDAIAGAAYRGQQRYYVYFHRPADVNKMALLVWKNLDRDDDRWLYLPALDLVKRIAAADKRTSFAGSDFFYEDVSGRSVDLDSHQLIDVTENYYVLRNTPKDPASVEFAYYDAYIHKGTFLPVRIEYFDRGGEKYRIYDAMQVERIQGYPTVTKSRMANLRTGGSTVVTYTGVRYDVDLPEDIFTERFLRRSPRQFLR